MSLSSQAPDKVVWWSSVFFTGLLTVLAGMTALFFVGKLLLNLFSIFIFKNKSYKYFWTK